MADLTLAPASTTHQSMGTLDAGCSSDGRIKSEICVRSLTIYRLTVMQHQGPMI